MNRTTTLHAALSAVETRGKSYGTPENNFLRIARRWNVHLLNRYGARVELDATDVAAMMADMKLARLEETPSHQDSWTDLAGYAACGAEVSVVDEKVAADLIGEMAVSRALAEPDANTNSSWSGVTIRPGADEVLDDGRRV